MTTKERITNARASHAVWLMELGANRDEAQRGVTYLKLRSLERMFDRVSTKACNGELAYDEATDTYPELEQAETKVFTAIANIFDRIPDGFEINRDPRGYALKINDEVMREQFQNLRDRNIHAYTDFGGYGILAPDFN